MSIKQEIKKLQSSRGGEDMNTQLIKMLTEDENT